MQEVAPAVLSVPASKWQLVKEALSGTEQDFTVGSLHRGIALLAIPTICEMIMESTFGVVDAFWVAKLGADAIAVVGLTESLLASQLFGITPFDPDFESAMAAYERGAKKYRNALRELAR